MAYELGEPDVPLETWRVAVESDASSGAGEAQASGTTAAGTGATGATAARAKRTVRILEQIEQRVFAAPLFGGGTLAVVLQPGQLLRESSVRERLMRIVHAVPPGNGLALIDIASSGAKRTKASETLAAGVAAAGGAVGEFPAPTRERMERWIVIRAGELGARLGPGAAQLLAERIGAHVREGDVDRRRQTQLANAELEKLALYRPATVVSRDDVAELVSEAVPGSIWALLDAISGRRVSLAAELLERLEAQGTVLPILVAQLHRRLRDLLVVREALGAGTRPNELPRLLKLQPFRAQKLAQQADVWSLEDLGLALEGLLALDLESKGIALDGPPVPISDERSALALRVWLVERVAGSGGAAAVGSSARS